MLAIILFNFSFRLALVKWFISLNTIIATSILLFITFIVYNINYISINVISQLK